MKYPKLPEELDLRKKLLAQDILDIRIAYEKAEPSFPKSLSELMKRRRLEGLGVQSETQWINEIAEMYEVSYATVYYWIKDDSRAKQRLKNAQNHKRDSFDYERHVAREIVNRKKRWQRYSPLWDYHALQAAKNEKRSKRLTYKGKALSEWDSRKS